MIHVMKFWSKKTFIYDATVTQRETYREESLLAYVQMNQTKYFYKISMKVCLVDTQILTFPSTIRFTLQINTLMKKIDTLVSNSLPIFVQKCKH